MEEKKLSCEVLSQQLSDIASVSGESCGKSELVSGVRREDGEGKECMRTGSSVSSSAGPSTRKGKSFKPPANWANAPEFVPRWFTSK